ncbi:hypothetical protein GN244_ATG06775 [Phytophthora infestans]|uniref:Uncharacterized protein n=1 Tax=Phytophthora infestans TaxID=4787 RepID=A0A833S5G3_PHYIN|nr:hypothetical protein GN244_ATG06775 [Phytophthora infestans]
METKRDIVKGVSARSEDPYATYGYDSEYFDTPEEYDASVSELTLKVATPRDFVAASPLPADCSTPIHGSRETLTLAPVPTVPQQQELTQDARRHRRQGRGRRHSLLRHY